MDWMRSLRRCATLRAASMGRSGRLEEDVSRVEAI
jgi:hypothetical protein